MKVHIEFLKSQKVAESFFFLSYPGVVSPRMGSTQNSDRTRAENQLRGHFTRSIVTKVLTMLCRQRIQPVSASVKASFHSVLNHLWMVKNCHASKHILAESVASCTIQLRWGPSRFSRQPEVWCSLYWRNFVFSPRIGKRLCWRLWLDLMTTKTSKEKHGISGCCRLRSGRQLARCLMISIKFLSTMQVMRFKEMITKDELS